MQTYKVMPYPDYMKADIRNIKSYRADNIDNLRRNLAKEYENSAGILTVLNDNNSAIGDLFIGYKSRGSYIYWRKPFAGDDWQIVDPATGKLKGRY